MISTILTSLHIFVAISLIPMGFLLIAGSPKNRSILSIGWLVVVFGISSITYGLALNSVTSSAVSIWLIALLIFSYPVSPASLLISIYTLRPKLFSRWYISIPLSIFVTAPVVLLFLDAAGITSSIFDQNFVVTFDALRDNYTGGYLDLNFILTPTGGLILRDLLIVFYPLNIIFTTIVAIRDWKTDRFTGTGALAIAIAVTLSSIVSTVLRESLPVTLSALISNVIIAVGYLGLGINLLSKEKGTQNSWIQNILGDLRMFNKMLLSFSIVLIPAIAFLSFSTFSFFQTSLITAAEENLTTMVNRESGLIGEELSALLIQAKDLSAANRVSQALNERARYYDGLSQDEIESAIRTFEEQWTDNEEVLTSVTLDPAKSVELRNMQAQNPSILQMILVDPHGGLVTAISRPERFSYGFEDWFVALDQENEVQVYASPTEWSDERNTYTTSFAVPLVNTNGSFSGAILLEYDLNPVLSGLNLPNTHQVQYGIVTTRGELFLSSGNPEDQINLPSLALTPPAPDKSWRTFELLGEGHLVQTSQITNAAIGLTTPWSVVAFQPVRQAIAPLSFVQTTTLVVALMLILTNAGMAILFTQSITDPLEKLRNAAQQIQSGVRGAVAQISTRDEFGTLAATFNQMSEELNQVMTGLEDTIEKRTKDLQQRATQLEASAVVARDAAEVRDLSTLLETTVQLVPEKFGYYHCGIFLLDEAGKFAVLQAANSEGGKKMLERGHRLQVGRVGVVGYCAGTGNPRIAQDVGADVNYYANPDMPDTRSEMALPLVVRGQRIGVLDIQSTKPNAFREADIEILQVLADQLALAIDNTRLLEASQKALDELQVLYGRQASRAWQDKLANEQITYAYDSTGLTRSGAVRTKADGTSTAQISRPISFRGQVIGELDFLRDAEDGKWTDEEAKLIEEILEQTALALENARLVQQIRLRSDQIRLLQEITAMAASILDEGELLEQVADKLRTSLQLQHCGVVIREKDPDLFRLAASSTPEESDILVGNLVNINEDQVSRMIVDQNENLVIKNASTDPNCQVFVQTFCTRKKAALILLPLLIRDEVAGYIFLEDEDQNRVLDEEENELFNQIHVQVSTAMESARLFSAEQQGRMSAAALLEITQIASASLDINQVLNQATSRSVQAIRAHRCSILVLDEHEKLNPLVSVDAKGVAMEGEEWEQFRNRIKETYQRTPIRTLAANMRQPQIINDLEHYDNLPIDWAAEFNVKRMMSIPLISQNKVIGTMLYTLQDEQSSFQEDQIDLAQTIAGQIATTIENAKLFTQAVTRAERERQITEITAKIRSSNDPQVIMDTAISELRAALAESTIKAKQASQHRDTAKTNGN